MGLVEGAGRDAIMVGAERGVATQTIGHCSLRVLYANQLTGLPAGLFYKLTWLFYKLTSLGML
jgi:hypothetical protein